MKTRTEMIANLNVEIPDRTLAQSVLQRWSQQAGLSVRIVRGRITPEAARFELEIRGHSPLVSRILRQGAVWATAGAIA